MYRAGIVFLAMLMALAASAQTVDHKAQQSATQPTSVAQTLVGQAPVGQAANPATTPDPARQMQLDLDQMESLVNNMAAQVSFIRDTNMSILLNTNVRLWTVLIRDLRMQLQEQQQRHAGSEKTDSPEKR